MLNLLRSTDMSRTMSAPTLNSAGPGVRVSTAVRDRIRNYASARIEVSAPAVVLTGPNGAGKTNLLEAVSFLTPGRAAPGEDFEVGRFGADGGNAVGCFRRDWRQDRPGTDWYGT